MTLKIARFTAAWLLLAASLAHAKIEWQPLPPDEFSLKKPHVEEDAPAEILLKEIHFTVEKGAITVSEHARIKIFTDGGREYARLEIPYFGKDKIREMAGRTIKSDGTIQQVAADSMFDRIVVKSGGLKVKVASFAFPQVEAGDIVEYSWQAKTELRGHYHVLEIQAEVPAEHVLVTIKSTEPGIYANYSSFGLPSPAIRGSNGVSLEFENLPAKRQEPLMPPEANAHGWVLVKLLAYGETAYAGRSLSC